MGNIFPLGNQVDARLVETEPEFLARINEYSKTDSSGSIFGESAGSSKIKERRNVDTARQDNLDLLLESNRE
jgi:hypothetical protein